MKRTGAEYLRSLDDGRSIFVEGKKIASIFEQKDYAHMAHTMALLLDHPVWPNTDSSNWSPMWDAALSPQQLREKGSWYREFASLTGGLLGRSPDFLAAMVTAWYVNASYFQDRAENIRSFWKSCRQDNLILAHAISDPPSTYNSSGEDSPLLKVVERSSEGMIVRGMKMLATLGPYADFMLVYPYRQLVDDEVDAALCFAVPLNTPGLKLYARPALSSSSRSFSDQLDESDAIVEFDNVFVPNQYIFIDGSVDLANGIRKGTSMTTYAWHQSAARVWAKTRLMAESAKRGVDSLKKTNPSTLSKVADIYAEARILDALLTSAETECVEVKGEIDNFTCDHSALSVAVTHYAASANQWIETLSEVYGSALVIRPDQSRTAEIEGIFSGFYKAEVSEEMVFDLGFAHEMTSTPYGRRQVLYEKAFVGPPELLRSKELDNYAQGGDRVLTNFTRMCKTIAGD